MVESGERLVALVEAHQDRGEGGVDVRGVWGGGGGALCEVEGAFVGSGAGEERRHRVEGVGVGRIALQEALEDGGGARGVAAADAFACLDECGVGHGERGGFTVWSSTCATWIGGRG